MLKFRGGTFILVEFSIAIANLFPICNFDLILILLYWFYYPKLDFKRVS